MPRKATRPESSRPTLIYSSRTWRARLAQELVAAGIAHDTAQITAQRVLRGLTRPVDVEPEEY